MYDMKRYYKYDEREAKYTIEKINELIDETCFITNVQKSFYKYMLKQRFEKILLPAYKKLTEK